LVSFSQLKKVYALAWQGQEARQFLYRRVSSTSCADRRSLEQPRPSSSRMHSQETTFS